MDLSIPVSATMKEATVSAGILGIVLDQLSLLDDFSHLTKCDHSVGPRHLSHRVRQEEQAPCGGVFDSLGDSTRSHGSGRPLTLCSRVAAMWTSSIRSCVKLRVVAHSRFRSRAAVFMAFV